ncbi:MAG TPA: XrtA/PEP-CTERM system histidine kinase PrsK [Steroidobacteraceae bacterium]|nr:XrtA/PEP-CTERM system histidine kinase PrsK [Steroidobacteraceae bacterium]
MASIGLYSYGAAAAAFGVFAFLQLTRWRNRVHGSLLLPATLTSCVWAAALALREFIPSVSLTVIFALEMSRDALWLAFLLRAFRLVGGRAVPAWLVYAVYGSILLILSAGLGFGVLHDLGYPIDSAGAVLIPGGLLLSILGIVLVEQVYRNTHASHEWSVKFLWLGTGALVIYDFCLYSSSLLLRQIPLTMWEARGAANALCIPLFLIGLARTPNWSSGVFLSRNPAFYTLSFIAAGVYLMGMAVAGYYLRVFGGTWGGAAQMLFLFGAALLLVIVLFSGQARAWLRVFVTKHFLPYRYDYRAEWLRLTRTLVSSPDTRLPERVLQAIGQVVHSDAGGIWIAAEDGTFVPSGGDLAGRDSPVERADSEYLNAIAAREWITDLDTLRVAGAANQPDREIPAWLLNNERAWLVVPLLQESQLVAFVVVAKPLAPQTLTWEDLDLLRTVARHAASHIALEQAAHRLAQSQQFEAYNRFAAFMMHDLKNLIAQQTLVVQNAARHRGNPQFFDDAISTIDNSVRRMSRLMEQLRRGETAGQVRRVDLAEACVEAVRRCGDRRPVPLVTVVQRPLEVLASTERLTLVLEHVIRNAQDATDPNGTVSVEVRRNTEHAEAEVVDTGAGMDEAFIRDRLFRPFDSTKGSQGMGIGAFQTREFVRMCGGYVSVQSTVGRGTRFLIALPLAAVG